MRIFRTLPQRGLWCLPLLAAAGVACGSSNGKSGSPGTGGIVGAEDAALSGGATGAGGVIGVGGGTGTATVTTTGTVTATGAETSGGTGGKTGVGGASGGGGGSTGTGGTGGTGGADPTPSSGCSATTTPASGRFTIDVSGTSREYILALPANYDSKHPYRLIFAFHGGKYDAQSVADGGPPGSGPYYGIQAEASNTAIFVAPQATSSGWSSSDIPYASAMVTQFESTLCIDPKRIFATGFSMGAIMTITLGCNSADVFRAIAPMSGEISGTCTGTQPIAYWASHGTNDPTINISLGEAARDSYRTRNHCTPDTTAGNPTGCVNYQCDSGYPVIWCTFDGVHEPAPFAGTAIWAFFSQF